MKIVLKHSVRLSAKDELLPPGKVVDVPKGVADDLIARGAAGPLAGKPANEPKGEDQEGAEGQ